MEKFMMDHQINTLFHFTQASNLPSIFKHGLLPKETLLSQCIDTEYNDDYRHDKCPNAICMSIEYPNYKMFYSLRCKNTNIDWVVIKIDASVLLNFSCAFCISNAGSRESYSIEIEKRKGVEALEKLYQEYPGQIIRHDMNINNSYPTNPQAEVLVFGCVPLEYISEVCFDSDTTYMKYESCIPDNIQVTNSHQWFEPRCDWRDWQK